MMRHARHAGTGAVAAGHRDTARVGAQVLEAGGNAADAVVAMMLASTVVEGTLTSLGGGGFMIVGGGGVAPTLLDFFARQPGLGGPRHVAAWEVFALELDGTVLSFGTGPAAVAVPGLPGGIAHASRRFGRLPLTTVAEPAAELATSGVELTVTQAEEHAINLGMLSRTPEGRAVYVEAGGHTRAAGTRFRQPLLAMAIEEIAATGASSFYAGQLADRLVAWSDERGGRIAREDLTAFEVVEREPLAVRLGPVTVLTNPSPAMGGRVIARLLEAFVDHAGEGASRDVRVARELVRVLRELSPPRTRPPEHGEEVAGPLVAGTIRPTDLHHAAAHAPPHTFDRSPSTTHIAAVDGDGMMAGATTTVGYGSGEFLPGTGIQLNNMLAEYDHTLVRPPGSTVPSMMSPTLLEGDRTAVSIGSAGSDRIPQAIAQILERMWAGTPLPEAVLAPRFAFDGARLHCEAGLDETALAALDGGLDLVRWTDRDAYFGTSNGVAVRDGKLFAQGDVRREGCGIAID